MSNSDITLKTINELLPNENNLSNYWIPSYQRGYRWTKLQVTQLLDDIFEFSNRQNPKPEEFYCLQPIVIKENLDHYEVVDGQQRLTTIYLILRHFNERLAEKYRQPLFSLSYETRENFVSFLENPTEDIIDSNADFHYLLHAAETIEGWFSSKGTFVEDVKTTLLNKTKIIWFQLAAFDNSVDAFTRLNVGKIPLTNDELIRALFLKRSNSSEAESSEQQLQIAHEWDQLEKALQRDAFWYFLSNQSPKQNRIGFLFELIVDSENSTSFKDNDAYGIFYSYSKKFKDNASSINAEWLRIKQLYMLLEEWFEDRTLYHVIGYLINRGESIISLRELSLNCTKTEFKQNLIQKIFEEISDLNLKEGNPEDLVEEVTEYLDNLSYANRRAVKTTLLLFNVATLLANHKSNIRFQFDSFKSEVWDIEHIRSVANISLDSHTDRVRWLNLTVGYLETVDIHLDLAKDIQAFTLLPQREATQEKFEALHNEVLKAFKEDNSDETDDGIFNLTLLDQTTNRSYKNAVFAVKRQRLLELDQAGIFVPICTRNVFLKSHSAHVDNNMFWSKEDRDGYRTFMINTLISFFSNNMGELA